MRTEAAFLKWERKRTIGMLRCINPIVLLEVCKKIRLACLNPITELEVCKKPPIGLNMITLFEVDRKTSTDMLRYGITGHAEKSRPVYLV